MFFGMGSIFQRMIKSSNLVLYNIYIYIYIYIYRCANRMDYVQFCIVYIVFVNRLLIVPADENPVGQ